jgi:hypothetical protein
MMPAVTPLRHLSARHALAAAVALAGALALSSLAMGCEANLETTCTAGDCTDYVPPDPPVGPYMLPEDCLEGCAIDAPTGMTGEYPCAVDAIIDNCRRCHVEPQMGGAPFSLDTYADSQELYFGGLGNVTRFATMTQAVATDFMPLVDPKLTDEEKVELLDNWACICAPPRDAGETCE